MLNSGAYVSIGNGYKLNKRQLLDGRQEYNTLEDMKAAKDMQMPQMILGFCLEDEQVYLYKKSNTKDPVLGKWRPLSVDVELNVRFEDVDVEDADVDVLYVVGEDVKYTHNNSIWIYLNPQFKAQKKLLRNMIIFNGQDVTFNLPTEVEGMEFEFYINGVRNFEGHDYEVDRTKVPNQITLDTVYDSYDTCNISYCAEQMIRQVELVNNRLSTAFFNKYYEKYPAQTLIISDSDTIDSDLYIPIGNYDGETIPTWMKINNFTYDDQLKEIRIGVDSKILARVWLVKDNMFYICAPLLAAITAIRKQTVITIANNVYQITNKNSINKELQISSICTVNDQPGYTHEIKVISPTQIEFWTGHGSQGVGIVLKDGTHELLTSTDILYRVNRDTGSIGVRVPSNENGTMVSYARYPNLNSNQPYTTEDVYKLSNVLYVLNKGTAEIEIEVHQVVD